MFFCFFFRYCRWIFFLFLSKSIRKSQFLNFFFTNGFLSKIKTKEIWKKVTISYKKEEEENDTKTVHIHTATATTTGSGSGDRVFVGFLIQDLKHRLIREISSAANRQGDLHIRVLSRLASHALSINLYSFKNFHTALFRHLCSSVCVLSLLFISDCVFVFVFGMKISCCVVARTTNLGTKRCK